MNQKEIKELIELLVDHDITEFELERGDVKVHVKRGNSAAPIVHVASAMAAPPLAGAVVPPPMPYTPAPAPTGAAPPPEKKAEEPAVEADLHLVKSPIVGTFYEAPSPGTPPFVKVGDAVKEGQVLCIIEAMKLMNEIEAEVSGVLAKAFVSNGSPVEYGMALFGIRKQ
jgi:acetyl-CoA carboxylase biotin carboxyl carrier protein